MKAPVVPVDIVLAGLLGFTVLCLQRLGRPSKPLKVSSVQGDVPGFAVGGSRV